MGLQLAPKSQALGCGGLGELWAPTPIPPLLPQPKLTPQERLKLRMQKALNRQCKSRPPVQPELWEEWADL